MTNIKSLSNDDGNGNENGRKATGLAKLPNFKCASFIEKEKTTQKFSFPFVNLDTVLSDSTPEISPIFDKSNDVK